ncbi:MAG: hypothetical protein C4589_00590 [Peptococcaceae bacterium]|nr:MAG: hypothetical protein C4589_00590 [Peptococcaceae bacterium]
MHLANNYWQLAKVVTAYIGAVIGAGFASGQEILQFFSLYGWNGLLGVIIAAGLFSYLGSVVMFLAVQMNTSSYRKLLFYLMGFRAGKIMDIFNMLMLLGGLGVMLAGSGAVFSEFLGLPSFLGVWLVALLTCMVILGGLNGLLTVNVFLVPLKFLVIVFVSIAVLVYRGGFPPLQSAPATAGVAGHWLWASILYVSYNMVVPVAVLSSLGRTVPLKTGVIGGALGGLGLGLAAALIFLVNLSFYPEIAGYQVPLLFAAGRLGSVFQWALGLLIWLAIFTTAIADAHGFASRLSPGGGIRYRLFGIGACLLVLPLANFGFASLVRVFYPFFGYAGLILLVSLLITPLVRFSQKR